ncbi:MAG: dihydrolipoamide acetyltransferase [Dehalococcoidia bacterium]|nr:dihydrolipoamide acetyltransferase [Dehalococcoidia bacterium]|tara:strand:- start:2448 stop:3719 length:1272 start_codon:yes stop_codon:yes gene_type:complete
MSDELNMPQMGYDMKEGTIVRWLIETGSHVDKNEIVAEIETDKAVVEFQSYLEGFITQILVKEGNTVPVGEAIALVGSKDEIVATEPENVKKETETNIEESETTEKELIEASVSPTEDAVELKSTISKFSVKASPVARKLAKEKGYDLSKIEGTGPAGRITREDVELYIPSDSDVQFIDPVNEEPPGTVETEESINEESSTLTKMRQQIARVTVKSKTEIPHFYISVDVDMTKALEMRKQVNKSEQYQGLEVSINDLILKACINPLIKYPKFNSSFSDKGIVAHSKINIGIAISQEAGLIVPAIMDIQNKSLKEICIASKDLAQRSNEGTITTDEYARGTFAVSNLGMFNIKSFVGIIYPPQSAMLAVGSATRKPVVVEGNVVIADIMTATISGDHRIVDGAEAALFINEIKAILENPYQLLI